MVFSKPFDAIEAADVLQLVANRVREGRELDYKQELPGTGDGDKKEFLRDITSFANTNGGWLLYGVTELVDADGHNTGEPDKCTGLALTNPADEEIRRLGSLILTGVEPALVSVQIKDIADATFASRRVFVVHVPDSWAKPHMITLKSDSRFYGRVNSGKFPMDVTQIKASFLASEALVDRIRAFREKRVMLVADQHGAVPLVKAARLVLHIVPLRSFEAAPPDITLVAAAERPDPIAYVGDEFRTNFDGYLSYRS
jgi:hypothetical protein